MSIVPSAAGGTVVVCGEALVDLVVRSDGTLVPHLGGGPYNAARTAARLGVPTAFLGRVSNDRFGEQLVAGLAADGVDTATVVRSEEPTMLALAEISAAGGASYRFYVEGTATPGLTAADALAHLPATVSALCVGTLGLVLEPMATAVRSARRGRARPRARARRPEHPSGVDHRPGELPGTTRADHRLTPTS